MYTSYWIVFKWWRDQVGSWHVGWGLLILVTTLLSLWTVCLVKTKIKHFWFVTWLHNWSVTWLCGWGSFILSHHSATSGSIRLMKVEIYYFLFVKWPQYQNVTWLLGWGPIILSHHPAKFGVHRPCEDGDKTFLICLVITWSMCHGTL